MTIDEAYAVCRSIAHKHGANFSVGFRFLPPAKRRAVYAAYAFCRIADDIADEAAADAQSDGAVERMARLDAWQQELDAAYEHRATHPVAVALSDAIRYFPIPKSAFVALIDGCRLDMVKSRYETFDELLHYCELVASSISDMSLAIFGYRKDSAIEHGRSLSTALQLTNIARDVGDDLTRDRIYIPQEDLRRFGVTENDLFTRRENDSMRALMMFQIDRAESWFRAAEPLLGELEFDARFPTLLMGGIYATVLGKLRKDPLIAIRKRLSLSKMQKILVVGSRMLRPHFV